MNKFKLAATASAIALPIAVLWLIAAFFVGAHYNLVFDIVFGPPYFVKTHILPYETAAFIFGKDSQGAHNLTSFSLYLLMWWLFFSLFLVVVFLYKWSNDRILLMNITTIATALVFGAGTAIWIVASAQRKLTVAAREDIPILDAGDRKTVIGMLRKGEVASVLRCEDRKSTIDPIVELSGGQVGELGNGQFRVISQRTGILSRPQFLNCGDY